MHDARIVRLNSAHRPDHMRTWLGDSVGHWEGDTLVVKTKNFTPRPGLYGADENLQVTERFRRVDDATLSYSFVVDNPTVWSEPWVENIHGPRPQLKCMNTRATRVTMHWATSCVEPVC